MKVFQFFAVILLAMLATGCTSPSQDLALLRVGMIEEQVVKIMGSPERTNQEGKKSMLMFLLTADKLSRNSPELDPQSNFAVAVSANVPSRNGGQIPSQGGYSLFDVGRQLVSYYVFLENGRVTVFGTGDEVRKTLKKS